MEKSEMAKKIAYLICNRRKVQPFTTTSELAQFLDESIPKIRVNRGGSTLLLQIFRPYVSQ